MSDRPERAAHILRDHLNSFEMRFSRSENLAQLERMKELADLACAEIDAQDAEAFKLAAGVCEYRGGNAHGNPLCLKTNQPI